MTWRGSRTRGAQNKKELLWVFYFVPSAGIEPASQVPQTWILSIELREHWLLRFLQEALAEEVRFELTVRLPRLLFSRQVQSDHSATPPYHFDCRTTLSWFVYFWNTQGVYFGYGKQNYGLKQNIWMGMGSRVRGKGGWWQVRMLRYCFPCVNAWRGISVRESYVYVCTTCCTSYYYTYAYHLRKGEKPTWRWGNKKTSWYTHSMKCLGNRLRI